jgi:GAF domain-containing protein
MMRFSGASYRCCDVARAAAEQRITMDTGASEHPGDSAADHVAGNGDAPEDAHAGAVDALATDDDSDLRSSLAGLSQLATGRLELTDVLTRVAEFAVRAIPGADGAGLTLIEERRQDTIVASAPFVVEVDAIQYGIGEGPCITAAAEGQTMHSGDLAADPQWPRFGPRVGRLGVHSVLSLPLITPDGVVGAMNVYAHERDAFDKRAIALGELFAVPAAIAVQNAQVLAQAKRVAVQLHAALTHRAVIDQALGILMSRAGCSAEEAFDRLRRMSQTENSKLHDIAEKIVADAIRRARARHIATD